MSAPVWSADNRIRSCRLRPCVGWVRGVHAVPVRWTGLLLRRCSFGGRRGSLRPRRAEHDQRLAALVLRRDPDLIAGELQRDPACGPEFQPAPIDRDLARADAEEPAEVDDGGADMPVLADNDIDDPPHVLIGAAAYALADDPRDLLVVQHHCRRARGRSGRRRVGGWRRRSAGWLVLLWLLLCLFLRRLVQRGRWLRRWRRW